VSDGSQLQGGNGQWGLGGGQRLAVAGRRAGLEGGDPFLPGGLGVGVGWQAAGELEQDHAVGEGEDRPGELGSPVAWSSGAAVRSSRPLGEAGAPGQAAAVRTRAGYQAPARHSVGRAGGG
jgi:hypothetical protein